MQLVISLRNKDIYIYKAINFLIVKQYPGKLCYAIAGSEMLGEKMHSNFCYTKPISYSPSCNLSRNSQYKGQGILMCITFVAT